MCRTQCKRFALFAQQFTLPAEHKISAKVLSLSQSRKNRLQATMTCTRHSISDVIDRNVSILRAFDCSTWHQLNRLRAVICNPASSARFGWPKPACVRFQPYISEDVRFPFWVPQNGLVGSAVPPVRPCSGGCDSSTTRHGGDTDCCNRILPCRRPERDRSRRTGGNPGSRPGTGGRGSESREFCCNGGATKGEFLPCRHCVARDQAEQATGSDFRRASHFAEVRTCTSPGCPLFFREKL